MGSKQKGSGDYFKDYLRSSEGFSNNNSARKALLTRSDEFMIKDGSNIGMYAGRHHVFSR